MGRFARRALVIAAWLGWQIESNWTDPFLFFVYSIVKPIASVLMLVVLYLFISSGETQAPLFAYLYVGNAFYIYVTGVIVGVSWAVIDDREHYGTLKYIYLTPAPFVVYLVGRGLARLITSTIAVIVTLLFGVLVLHLPLTWGQADIPLFLVTFVLGIAGLALIGLVLGAATLLMARNAWNIGEATAGALFLFSGAIFPLSVLPDVLRPIGLALPMTYWLELIRRALFGTTAAAFPTFAGWSTAQLLATLAVLSLLYGAFAVLFFQWAENHARQLGLLDQETRY